MNKPKGDDIIELRAADPQGDLACDFTIATEKARSGIAETLAAAIVPPVRRIDGGVEVRFIPSAWDRVRGYVELESRCCSFLTLAAQRLPDAVVLRVTGRAEALPVIEAIFAPD